MVEDETGDVVALEDGLKALGRLPVELAAAQERRHVRAVRDRPSDEREERVEDHHVGLLRLERERTVERLEEFRADPPGEPQEPDLARRRAPVHAAVGLRELCDDVLTVDGDAGRRVL